MNNALNGDPPISAPAELRRIALFANSEQRYFFIDLARELRSRYGSEIHFYCLNKEEMRFYRRLGGDDAFTSLQIATDPLRVALNETAPDRDSVVAKARAHEARIGCTYNTLAHANRHLGRGYILGAPNHPRSGYSEKTDYADMLNGYNRAFDFWLREVDEKGLTLVMAGDKVVARAAFAAGLPFRRLAGARYKNYYYWSPDEFFSLPGLCEVFDSIAAGEDVELTEAYHSHTVYSRQVIKESSFPGLVHRLADRCLRRVYWWLRRYEAARGYYGRDELLFMVRQWRDARRMTGKRTRRLDQLPADLRFLYFPLHTEPEASVNQLSPEYFYQHAAIAALSRDLPAGIMLAVKETVYGTGRRPKEFYRHIADLKNVIWLDMLEPGIEVVRRATAVATITGTAGFEASVMGKPVISFGRHNLYNFLPHVFPFRDEARLKDDIATIFGAGVDGDRARSDGARFLKAIVACSFSMGLHSTVDLRGYDRDAVADAANSLAASLAPPVAAAELVAGGAGR